MFHPLALGLVQPQHRQCPRAAVLLRAPRRTQGDGGEKAKGAQTEAQWASIPAGRQPVSCRVPSFPCFSSSLAPELPSAGRELLRCIAARKANCRRYSGNESFNSVNLSAGSRFLIQNK